MNFKNRKKIIFLMFLVILLLGLSVASATNVKKTSDKVSNKSVDTSKAVKNSVVDKKVVKNNTKENVKTATTKKKTKITVSGIKKQYEYGDNIQIKAKLIDSSNKAICDESLTLRVNKKTYKLKTNKNGFITETHTISSVGTQNISLTFAGSKNYYSSNMNKTIISTKRTTRFLTNESNFNFYKNNNKSYCIRFRLNDLTDEKIFFSSNEIKVIINNKTYNLQNGYEDCDLDLYYNRGNFDSLNNSKDKIILNDFNQISISYLGNKNYLPTNYSFNLTKGDKYHTSISWWCSSYDSRWGSGFDSNYKCTQKISYEEDFTAELNSDYDYDEENIDVNYDLLKILINGKKYNNDYKLTPGTYIVSAEYPGSSTSYSSYAVNNLTIKIVDYPSKLVLKKVPQKNTINKKITFYTTMKFNDGDNVNVGKIYYTINGKEYKRSIDLGESHLDFTPKKAGKYKINVKYAGFNSKKIKNINTSQSFTVVKDTVKRELKIKEYYFKNVTETLKQRIILVVSQKNPYNNRGENVSNLKINVNVNGKKFSYKALKNKLSFKKINHSDASNTFDIINIKEDPSSMSYSYYSLLIPASKKGLNVVTISSADKRFKFPSKKIKYTVNDLSKALPFHIKLKSNVSFVYTGDDFRGGYDEARIYATILNKKNKLLPVNGIYKNFNITNGCFVVKRDSDEENTYFSGKIKLNIAKQKYSKNVNFYVHNNTIFTLENKILTNKKFFNSNKFPNVLLIKSEYANNLTDFYVFLDNHEIEIKEKYNSKTKIMNLYLDKNIINKYLSKGQHIIKIKLSQNYDEDDIEEIGLKQSNYYDIYIK